MPFDIASIVTRAETPEDESFLFELYASTRKEELDGWGWPPEMRNSFLQFQFKARKSYRASFPQAQFQVLLLQEERIGRMAVDRCEEEIHLIDIALLPAHRNHGIGTALLQSLSAEAAAAKKPLRLSVLKGHRATNLYRRLGFLTTNESGLYQQMEWRR